jgi:N-acetylglucosaminyldiphosphoundecaprenol N-acetyl-beta-D-mannosaminyltransferase
MINGGKRNVLGVLIDEVDYDSAVSLVVAAAREQQPFALTALAVHGVMTGVSDDAHAARLNSFDLVTPDGQPVRWALNMLHHSGLSDRVYGPSLTWRVLERCAADGLPVFLYGSTEPTLERLTAALTGRLPGLKIAGTEPSKFRLARPGEATEIADRIRSSGARLVLVGLGCPRQEQFAYAMRGLLDMPLLAVGAAFDYHSGTLRPPPPWVQKYGLEWLWRLGLEPRRLWRRYVLLNPSYVARVAAQLTHIARPIPAAPAAAPLAEFPV